MEDECRSAGKSALLFVDLIAWGWRATCDIGNQEGGIAQGIGAQIGGFPLIDDADEGVAGLGSAGADRVNQDETILLVHHLDGSDEAGGFRLGRRSLSRDDFADQVTWREI